MILPGGLSQKQLLGSTAHDQVFAYNGQGQVTGISYTGGVSVGYACSHGEATAMTVIDCYTRQLLGWHLSRTDKAGTAAVALEQALVTRFGTLGRVPTPFLLRSDNGLVFTSRHYTRLVRSYGLQQEFITPHCPQQIGMVERVVRTLKEQCVHRHRFESQQHATRVVGDWIRFYNHQRPHQALGMKTPAEAYVFSA